MFMSLRGGPCQTLFRSRRPQPVTNTYRIYLPISRRFISGSFPYSISRQYQRNATGPARQQFPSFAVRQRQRSSYQTLKIIHSQQTSVTRLAAAAAAAALLPSSASAPILPPSACRAFATSPPQAVRISDAREDMASDEDYMAFLNKANQDPSEGVATSTSAQAQAQGQGQEGRARLRATQQGVEVPAPLAGLVGKDDAFYVSDADEPFEAVALGWDEAGKGLPDEEEFARLIQHWDPKNAEVEIMDPVDWDRNGQYVEVIDAVREAGQGNDVRVYRLALGGVRVEYWVLTTEGKGAGAKLVGVRALAVES
ncbi:hypothetical protein MMYC01_200727 [Madurella mycetomatis]|uniref:Uncharacterized protein n=1 Tax=Madurella mycetomatis TaxID=100816 RepID=A0A175WGD3_9PEZI|nr:hypothetical protein MMYC01_200727 [Madurella mycetomatis]